MKSHIRRPLFRKLKYEKASYSLSKHRDFIPVECIAYPECPGEQREHVLVRLI
jgi:hypothetical protein